MSKFAGFTSVQLKKPQRSQFDLSHFKRTSTRMGRLTPVLCVEALPGDTFNGSSECLLRLGPLLAPIYDEIHLYVHFFFVPNRIQWNEWETFITGGRLGVEADPDEAPIPPRMNSLGYYLANNASAFLKSQLWDYMGCPIVSDLAGYAASQYNDLPIDMLPFMAYQRVYMDYFRDRNYVADDFFDNGINDTSFPFNSGAMSDIEVIKMISLRTRSYQADYFTSALPFTQRGAEVLMPLAGTGSVTYLDQSRLEYGNNIPFAIGPLEAGSAYSGGPSNSRYFDSTDNEHLRVENIDSVLFDASSVSINDFRTAYAMQVWLERNAVAGSRYTESNQAHFGVHTQDSRLQRAEYIGGGRIPVKITEIVSTAYSDDGSGVVPLANLAGHGQTYGNTNRFHYFCPEHGFIIGIASIMNPPSYHQGFPRMFFQRRYFLDYPFPTFAKLGEQEVYTVELYGSGSNLSAKTLFGYQSRYADWKHMHNSNNGDFHDTLLFWTLTREFSSSPTLGQTFVQFDASTQDRIFAVNGTGDNFWMYVHNNLTVVRCLPYFGTPNTLGFS